MRKNIFLDFLSPDNWKTYSTIPKDPKRLTHYRHCLVEQLKQSINIAILLTPEYCILPPAFIVQSGIAFQAIRKSALYLDDKRIFFPLRETSIDRYIAKKISEYQRVKDSHTGFYDDTHWDFLSKYQHLIIHRKATMGLTIAQQWQILPDESNIWDPIVTRNPYVAERLRPIPSLLKTRGESVTLEAIFAELKETDPGLERYINQAIQHEYLKTYLDEYDLSILSNAPPKPLNENYLIEVESLYYDFLLFTRVLALMGIKEYFLYAHPKTILQFMCTAEYDILVNTFFAICESSSNGFEVENTYKTLLRNTGKDMRSVALFNPCKDILVKDRIDWIGEAFLLYKKNMVQKKREITTMKNFTLIVTTPTEYSSAVTCFSKHGYTLEDDNSGDMFFKKAMLKNGIVINLIQTEIGANQVGGAFNTTRDIIEMLCSDAIIIGGICFGVQDKEKTRNIADILVSTDIWDYETAKITNGVVEYRGKMIPVSTRLLQLFRRTSDGFKPPVHFGVMGAGAKNVNDPSFVDNLLKGQPQIIGGDMEGYAVVSACQAKKVDCILVKSICDWGQEKVDDYQTQAAKNSIEFVIKALESVKI